jgi:hypothetical protein
MDRDPLLLHELLRRVERVGGERVGRQEEGEADECDERALHAAAPAFGPE